MPPQYVLKDVASCLSPEDSRRLIEGLVYVNNEQTPTKYKLKIHQPKMYVGRNVALYRILMQEWI